MPVVSSLMKRLKDETLLKRFGQRLREARKAKGLTQEVFEEEFGVDQSRLGRIERGEINITLSTADMLADAVGVPLSELVSRNK